jgi:hypothetical protein
MFGLALPGNRVKQICGNTGSLYPRVMAATSRLRCGVDRTTVGTKLAIAVLLGPITLSGNSIVRCRDRTVCTISNTLHVFQELDIVSNKLLFLFEGKAFEEIGTIRPKSIARRNPI